MPNNGSLFPGLVVYEATIYAVSTCARECEQKSVVFWSAYPYPVGQLQLAVSVPRVC